MGTNYQYVDPCGRGRNWFMLWCRVDAEERRWVYREWPCARIPVPGIGFPGAWAETGSSKTHKFGGVPGPGQKGFGLTLGEYKNEIARLEGWEDVRSGKPVEDWRESNGTRERIYQRKIDSRPVAIRNYKAYSENTTLLEEMADIGLFFEQASGKGVDEGLDLINDGLGWKDEFLTEEDPLRAVQLGPKLFICEDCQNLLFALKVYTSMGGDKEATKDPIDTLRYLLMDDPCYVPNDGRQGGYSGRGYGMRAGAGGGMRRADEAGPSKASRMGKFNH
ncbi:MAG: hypothetical protein AAGJ81_10665 [Verrucomicrobiota bacterium]